MSRTVIVILIYHRHKPVDRNVYHLQSFTIAVVILLGSHRFTMPRRTVLIPPKNRTACIQGEPTFSRKLVRDVGINQYGEFAHPHYVSYSGDTRGGTMLSNMAISSISVFNPLSTHFVAQNYCACAQNTFQFLRASSSSSLFFFPFYFMFPPCAVAALMLLARGSSGESDVR
jgi:hypothetical protein